ncbi:ChrR family anti-sigma-E factor [Marinomonas sp. 15G1-11]|uniref:ChrR family anti-sigma-E factor n=1 Tax=Marinomonas phaeophyticola TaxID=3004091 RepID=A0ABT4JSE5_9GAMM|nr:ChrR family anti-sigma-E factor [Marinomonas sp. 15G1-11]MCZ2721302.1 ChrR family anti-sigma-E factor [Marinomonas sp. 15G1-11]
MLNYHPTIELLTDYTAGSLALSYSLCIATHLEQCKECRAQVKKLEHVGSVLFDEIDPLEASSNNMDDLKQAFFNRLEEQNKMSDTMTALNTVNSHDGYRVPRSLQQFVPEGYDALNWVRISPSFQTAILANEENGTQIALTRVKAGSNIPTHTHTGDEFTLVLEGSFSDQSGVYKRGDFVQLNQQHTHKPVVTRDAECICLTIVDAPIQFTGLLTRLLNPILRKVHPYRG